VAMRCIFSIKSIVRGRFKWQTFVALSLLNLCGSFLIVTPSFAQNFPAPYVDQRSRQEEYLNQISDRCRTLHTALAQRNRSKMTEFAVKRLSKLRSDYEDSCQDEVMEAQENVRNKADKQRKEKYEAVKTQKEQSVQKDREDAMSRQQCTESRRIIANKRTRNDLTSGELVDLNRFEENIRLRCSTTQAAK
jgi:hypothetical protein